ncbi:unnamed protein product [Adineta steineri]|uniref:Flavin-containing monooxygenase n=1 Tax=Adineta steineri TaxID=433720 RepID=A0A814FHU3_9BILA|nr:unnamed protein product [Adineta steineri]CAF4045476.1 unnamed protein product [Adineta steineri]
MVRKSVAIIGAGVSGLEAGQLLLEDGFDITIFGLQIGPMNCAPWQNIHNYLKRYADEFHLIERIRFERKIILIDKNDLKNDKLSWIVKVETASGDHETFEFDLIVVATGLFSTPEKPNFRGQNKFSGSIMHITDIKSEDQLKNKRVIVIGGAKSAVDMATLAALHANYGFSRIFTHIFDPFPNVPHSAAFYFLHRVFSFVFTKITDSIANFLIS